MSAGTNCALRASFARKAKTLHATCTQKEESIDSNDVKWLLAEQIPHLRRYARALTGDVHEADDLVQDCLERAIRKRRLWLRRGSIRAWAFKILYRTHISRRRLVREKAQTIDVADAGLAVAPLQLAAIRCGEALQALSLLPDDQRAAVTLVAIEDFAYDDAARILGVPLGTLRSRLSRGRAALRELLQDTDDAAANGRPRRTHLARVK